MQPLMTKPGAVPASRPKAKISPQDNTGGPQPCQSALDEQSAIYAGSGERQWVLTADQMAYNYEFSPLYKSGHFGQGQTVAIVELGESNLTSDVAAYQSCYGTDVPVAYENLDGFKNSGAGEGEAALDIETVATMAPKANIIVYRGPSSNDGWYDTFASVAAQDVAQDRVGLLRPVRGDFTRSRTSLASAMNVVYEQEAVQGQTVLVSAGDDGSEGCLRVTPTKTSLLSAEFPASDPYVLSVGGTSVVSPNPVA